MRYFTTIVSNMHRRLRLKAFQRDVRGSVAIIFGFAAIPLTMAVGVAIDFNRTIQAESTLQALADRAALAGASYSGDVDERIVAAKDYLAAITAGLGGVTYTSDVVPTVADDVQVSITAQVKGTLLPLAMKLQSGGDGNTGGDTAIGIQATARTVITPGELLCLIALGTTGTVLEFKGTGDVTATGCGFYSNSSSSDSLYLNGSSEVTAAFFDVVGGYVINGQGEFSETPETGVAVMADPLNKSVTCPSSSGATSPNLNNGDTLTAVKYTDLNLGTNKTVTLNPSTGTDIYVFGTITVKNNSKLITNGKTIILCGANAKFDMTGGNVQLLAPTTGVNAGYAVIGSGSSTSTSVLTGGADTWVRGIWYTAKGTLELAGNAIFNSNSKYFPVIVKTLRTVGTTGINIEMDWAAYGFSQPEGLVTDDTTDIYLIN
jgi:Flp pilus assembly protein TadG